MVDRWIVIPNVLGSIPSSYPKVDFYSTLAQLVELDLDKVAVVGSIPTRRTIFVCPDGGIGRRTDLRCLFGKQAIVYEVGISLKSRYFFIYSEK